jgi:hypothetical protein
VDYTVDLGGNLATKAKEDADALRALQGSLGATGDALKKFHDEQAKAAPAPVMTAPGAAPEAPKRGRGRPRKEVDPDAPVKPKKAAPLATAVGVETGDFAFMKATKASADAAALKGKQSATEAYYAKVRALEASSGKDSDSKREKKSAKDKAASGEALTLAKGAAIAGAAALGVAGVGSIAKLALGYKGMFALQGISYRLGLSFRSLFSGVNPAPVIRAAQSFADQFKKTSVMGAALEGLFSRAFNGLFVGVEKATPYVIAFTQGIVIGFLEAENYILRARIALAPYAGILDGIVSSSTGLETAAIAGGAALVIFGASAATAMAPLLPYAAAIGAVALALEQINKLSKEWDENSSSQIWAKLKQDVGFAPTLPKGMTTGADYDKLHANDKAKPVAAAGGVEAGAALGAGMVKGMAASEAAVMAGGAKMAGAAIKGVRTEAEIKSPSRKTRRDGRYMGQGMELGLDDSGPGVQEAAERNLVPNVGGMRAGSGAGSRGNGQITIEINSPLVSVVASGIADLEAAALAIEPRLRDAMMRAIALALGVPAEA